MKVVVVSDIHANLEAVRAIHDVVAGADQVVCLGDLVGYYCQVNETIANVREWNAICVLGNHDWFLLRPEASRTLPPAVQFGITHASAVITPSNREWLASLPLTWGGEIGGLSWLVVHGSPWRPLLDYIYSDSPLLPRLDDFGFDVLAFGQTHYPYFRTTRRPILINPGSVGQSRHRPGVACAAVIETTSGKVTLVEREYDCLPVIARARQHGAGDWIEQQLLPANS